MTTRPAVQKRWPQNAEAARKKTIEHADAARLLLEDAREKIKRREHPALVQLDIADAMAYLAKIEQLMKDAKEGVE